MKEKFETTIVSVKLKSERWKFRGQTKAVKASVASEEESFCPTIEKENVSLRGKRRNFLCSEDRIESSILRTQELWLKSMHEIHQ